MASSSPLSLLPQGFDHLVIATPHLLETVDRFRRSTGVDPALGGNHPLMGTRNYLVGLGPSAYLEIIGRNPDASSGIYDLPFKIGELSRPAVATWALRVSNIGAARETAKTAGFDTGPEKQLSRRTPGGDELRWRLTPPYPEQSGVIPFLIDWAGSPNPATTGLPSVSVSRFIARHPLPRDTEDVLRSLGTNLRVEQGSAGLSMTIETPKGTVLLDNSTVAAW